MSSLPGRLWLSSLLGGFVAIAACQSSGPQSGKNNSSPTATSTDTNTDATPPPPATNTNTNTNTNTDNGANNGQVNSGCQTNNNGNSNGGNPAQPSPGSGLPLTSQAPNYQDDIQPLVNASCATTSCHASGGIPPDLSTLAGLQAKVAKALSDIQAGTMPMTPSPPLPSDQQAMFALWVSNGMPQTAQNGANGGSAASNNDSSGTINNAAPTDNTSNGNSSGDPCGNNGNSSNFGNSGNSGISGISGNGISSTTSTDAAQAVNNLLNPQALTDCHTQGKVYDRGNQICTQIPLATFPCTDAGILQVFQTDGLNIQTNVSGYEQAGYKIDQCGQVGNDPVVYFVMNEAQSNGTLKLDIKKLCRQGSAACN